MQKIIKEKYLIDGSSLADKMPHVKRLQEKDRHLKIAVLLEHSFSQEEDVNLYFDGYSSEPIRKLAVKIKFTKKQSINEIIKKQIQKFPNTDNIFVITSDSNLVNYAKEAGCVVISGEQFIKHLLKTSNKTNKRITLDTMKFKEQDYHINIFYSAEDEGYIADIPDLKYCSAFGNTPEEALKEVLIAKRIWLQTAKEEGLKIPPPKYSISSLRSKNKNLHTRNII